MSLFEERKRLIHIVNQLTEERTTLRARLMNLQSTIMELQRANGKLHTVVAEKDAMLETVRRQNLSMQTNILQLKRDLRLPSQVTPGPGMTITLGWDPDKRT